MAKESKKQQQQQSTTVVVSPLAFTTMFLHAASHSTKVVHGVLLGQWSSEKGGATTTTTITKAIPICHEHPTKPLVEISLALIQAHQKHHPSEAAQVVVGWYTAPERFDDERPGAAALRIVASLAAAAAAEKATGEPVLLVLRNGPLAKRVLQLEGDNKDDVDKSTKSGDNATIVALAKDFGQQWLQPLPIQIDQEAKARTAARDNYKNGNLVVDLVDHWESSSSTADWLISPSAAQFGLY